MKPFIWLLLILFYSIFSHAQDAKYYYEVNNQRAEEKAGYKNTKALIYFDINDNQIDKSVFEKALKSRLVLQIPGDSLHHRKLINRDYYGQILQNDQFFQLLETELNLKLDRRKPIVIVYYSGKNKCNSSGTSSKYFFSKWHKQMKAGLLGKTNEVLYLHRKGEIPPKKYSLLGFKEDPQGIAQQLFFPYNYPCGSFAIISKTGKYFAFYGEYGKPFIWKKVDQILGK